MKTLAVDIETFSRTDIKVGVHKYAEDNYFCILLFAYCFDGGQIEIVDLASGETLPDKVVQALYDPNILKTAYNAAFEIACLNKFLDRELDKKQWSCTMALAAQAGLPFGLSRVADILGTAKKDSLGKNLIKYFSNPCKPTKANGARTRNYPRHDFDKWLDFKEYCRQDVAVEIDIRTQLSWFDNGEFEKPTWILDQKINDLGVMVDTVLVRNAISIDGIVTEALIADVKTWTNIENPKSVAQVKKFIAQTTGVKVTSLSKENTKDILAKIEGTVAADALKIREKLSRTSIKKYDAMAKSACEDGRIRGLFQYYGANRTGRWAGRNVQVQNLKRNALDDLDFARRLVKAHNKTALDLSYDDAGRVLSNIIRTAFIPKPGCKFIVSDLNAIEARVISWLADERWRLDVFKSHGKIYEASAARMFGIPIESITKDSPERRRGKIAELALGYQGAVGALERMGGGAMGLSERDMLRLVKQWRHSNKKIVQLWYDVQDAAAEAISSGRAEMKRLKFYMKNNNLILELPSKRKLVYISAKLTDGEIMYSGVDQTSKKWGIQKTYGGKIVENATQAIARDVMTGAMQRLDSRGFNIVMHVHDEVVCENEYKEGIVERANSIMCEPFMWAPGLPLGAETFAADYYRK